MELVPNNISFETFHKQQQQKPERFMQSGHGKYLGKCGHVISQCRCPMGHSGDQTFQLDQLCPKCMDTSGAVNIG